MPRTSSYARFSIQIQTTCRIGGGFVHPHGPAARVIVEVVTAGEDGVTTGDDRGLAGAEHAATSDTTKTAVARTAAGPIASR